MNKPNKGYEYAIVAGGCFWCVESDNEKLPEVIEVVSGYSGGKGESPTYGDYVEKGHREVAKIIYDPDKASYKDILYHFIRHIDPTDDQGSFVDRGVQYSPAIYYKNEEEKKIVEEVLKEIESKNIFDKKIKVPILKEEKFWPAEDYHQGFYKKSPNKYKLYRINSGRDDFIKEHWEN